MNMRTFSKPLLFLVVLGVAALLSTCATANPPITESNASLTLLDRDSINRNYGLTSSVNPFIAPKGIRGEPYEFIVLELTTSFPAPAQVELELSVLDSAGKEVASLWDKGDFIDLWKGFMTNEADMLRREERIKDYMVPGYIFPVPKGRDTYVIPLIGKRPIPRPYTIKARVLYDLKEFVLEKTVQ
jgi:hypothetical protein